MKRKNGPRHTEVFHEAEYGQGRAPHHAFYLRRRGDKTVRYTPEEAAALYKALGQALARYRNEVTEHTDERCVHRISVYGRREGPFEVYRMISGWGEEPAGGTCGGRQAQERPADECRARARCPSMRPRHGCRFNRKNR